MNIYINIFENLYTDWGFQEHFFFRSKLYIL